MKSHWSLIAVHPNSRMDTRHLSDDVEYFVSSLKSSSGSFGFGKFMATSQDCYWVILNDAEFKFFQQHHVLQVVSRIQVTNSIGSSISVWQTQYITWSTSLWLAAFVMELIHHRSTSQLTHDHLNRHVGQSSSALGARRALRHEVTQLASTSSRTPSIVIIHG